MTGIIFILALALSPVAIALIVTFLEWLDKVKQPNSKR